MRIIVTISIYMIVKCRVVAYNAEIESDDDDVGGSEGGGGDRMDTSQVI